MGFPGGGVFPCDLVKRYQLGDDPIGPCRFQRDEDNVIKSGRPIETKRS